MGLKIIINITKSMSNVAMTTIATGIRFREFNYLGSTITQDGMCDREVLLCIAYAGWLFSQLKNIWRCRYFSQKLKLQLFRSNVLSVLLYGYESCSLSRKMGCQSSSLLSQGCLLSPILFATLINFVFLSLPLQRRHTTNLWESNTWLQFHWRWYSHSSLLRQHST